MNDEDNVMNWAEVMAEVEGGREPPSREPAQPSELQRRLEELSTGVRLLKTRPGHQPKHHKSTRDGSQTTSITMGPSTTNSIGRKTASAGTSKRQGKDISGVALTERQKRQALRAYRFKVGKVNQTIPATEERVAIMRKLNSIIKQVNKIESHLKHKTSNRIQPRRKKKPKPQPNHGASEMHNFETDSRKVPEHLRNKSLVEASRILVATECIIDNPPEILTEEYLMGTTYEEYEERVHFILENRASRGVNCGMINSPSGNISPLKFLRRIVAEHSSSSSSESDSDIEVDY